MATSTNEGGSREFVAEGAAFLHFRALSNELTTPKILVCPADKGREPASSSFPLIQNSNLSYFVGADEDVAQPQMFLSGDRNLTSNGRPVRPGLVVLTPNAALGRTKDIHNAQGNVALADGSAQQLSTPRLAQVVRLMEMETNRAAVP